jgi:hypothetical protein
MTSQTEPGNRRSAWRRWRQPIGYLIGALLLGACIVAAVRGGDWSALVSHWPLGLVLGGLVVINIALTGGVFTCLTRPFEQPGRPVGIVEMQALIGSSTLINYLPLRPGLFGRATYLKLRHGIALTDSLRILIATVGLSLAVYALFLLGVVVMPGRAALALAAVAAVVAVAGGLAWWGLLGGGRRLVRYAGPAALVRCADTLVVIARVMLAFAIIGQPISLAEATVLATSGMFITLLGITPNGLGLREWLYGLIAGAGLFGGDVVSGLELGLAAALIDRAAEAAATIPLGSVSLWWLRRRIGT